MHGSIRSELENVLAGRTGSTTVAAEHLLSCKECANELEAMRRQNELLRSWKAVEDAEPNGGFYARVMQRIEERAKDSIWAVFVYSPFGKRLAFASLSMAVLMGSYVLAEESRDGHLNRPASAVSHYDVPMVGNQAQLRDAVLQNFVLHDGEIH